MLKESLFIVIEGLDGSGKSSAAKALQKELIKSFPSKVKRSYEPENSSCGGTYIRDVLEKRITQFDPFVLALAYAANRLDHNSRIISPWLENGNQQILICDRYYLSSLVYNSSADFSYEQVMLLNRKARKPDIIFFLNASTDVCKARIKKRNEPEELFEKNINLFRKKYHSAIQFLRSERAENIIEIDANQPLDKVVEDMLLATKAYLSDWS